MKVGFTGTLLGMTDEQCQNLTDLLQNDDICPQVDGIANEFHHGDAIGADANAFAIATYLGWRTIAHPCDLEHKRAFTPSDIVMPVRRPLARNWIIVHSVDVLAAAPLSHNEVTRSGTWSTIRYARDAGIPYYLL